jgi:hypothetical protein
MKELTLDIPLLEIPLADGITTRLLEDLLRRVEVTYLFRIRGEGFLVICRVASHTVLGNPMLVKNLSRRFHVKILNRDKSGAEILQLSGTWNKLFNSKNSDTSRVIRFLKSAKGKPIYITGNPSFHGRMLRISLLGEEKTITNLLDGMKNASIPYIVAGLGSTRAHKESPLADLTARQASILKLAYSLGYYDVPKRTGVLDVARLLGIDKGTVGEHLQRAEKQVFDRLLS